MAPTTMATTGERATHQDASPADPFLTPDEAGALVRKTGRWVERHLAAHRNSGAPQLIVLPSTGRSGRAAAKLIDRDAWFTWVRSWSQPTDGRSDTDGDAAGPAVVPVIVPVGLQSASQRRRAARGF